MGHLRYSSRIRSKYVRLVEKCLSFFTNCGSVKVSLTRGASKGGGGGAWGGLSPPPPRGSPKKGTTRRRIQGERERGRARRKVANVFFQPFSSYATGIFFFFLPKLFYYDVS